MVLFLKGSLYASWTQKLLHDPLDACPTPGTPHVAAVNDHLCWPGKTWPDSLTAGGRGDDHRHCRRGGHEPSPYLQVGAALCAPRPGGAARQTRTRSPT